MPPGQPSGLPFEAQTWVRATRAGLNLTRGPALLGHDLEERGFLAARLCARRSAEDARRCVRRRLVIRSRRSTICSSGGQLGLHVVLAHGIGYCSSQATTRGMSRSNCCSALIRCFRFGAPNAWARSSAMRPNTSCSCRA